VSEFAWSLIVVGIYRSIALIAGILSIYLGYQLFRIGVYEKAGDLKAAWGSNRLVLKQAAPGTFFALFGALVITFGLWKGITVQSREGSPSFPGGVPVAVIPAPSAEPEVPAKPPEAKSESKSEGTQAKDSTSTSVVIPAGTAANLKADMEFTQIQPLLGKVVKGEPLTDDERKRLQDWYVRRVLFEKQWGIEANQPPSPSVKHELTG